MSEHVMRSICNSRTYQLSVATHQVESRRHAELLARQGAAAAGRGALRFDPFRHRLAERKIPGVPPGTRAAAMPDSGIKLPDNFLNNTRPTGSRKRLRMRTQQRPATGRRDGAG